MDEPDEPVPFIEQIEQALEPNWRILRAGDQLKGPNTPAETLLQTLKAGLARYNGDTSLAESLLPPGARNGHARFNGLAKFNEAKAALLEEAQRIAKQLWQDDSARKIRIGEMAQIVFAELYKEHSKLLPDRADQIRGWIQPVAPPYAMRPGRPKKTP
ncbi:TPA: hypothetical protein VDW09_003570 [Pseudomonas aeruginosa]|nr:hypothetical protein [Pseudomonas aeruginosa]MBG6831916.1 hypothetical protein [Pseudomonas aeruginosa]HCF2589489.1 hypothetical protein [Pseudomonas aeruginosa]HEP9719046.1 hypothetical protein [Pseudomonas aeruginosa]HEP9723862.1 hypothetical protein [Pseudomonas aeruginosa]